VEASADPGDFVQSVDVGEAMLSLRSVMVERVDQQEVHAHVRATVQRIFDDLVERKAYSLEDATDYLAGMTDRFALAYEV
jgi:hypothetical protein